MSYDPKSRIQGRLWAVLCDGQPHSYKELIDCIGDSQATKLNVRDHIFRMRRFLPAQHEIICVFFKRKRGYRLIVAYPAVQS